MLLGEVPAAFHAGVHDILLIAFALAVAEFLGSRRRADRHRRRGPRAPRGAGRRCRPVAHRGVVHHQVPGGLERWAGCPGRRWSAGEAALGAVIKDAKEQLRALPDASDLRRAALSEPPTLSWPGPTRRSGSTIWGGWAAAAAELSGDVWRIGQDGWSVTGAAAAVPMPLMHTVELNAGTVDTDAGPQLHANWTWAPSALDHAQVSRLSQLWFEALAGICAHVRARWGRVDAVRYRAGPSEPAADRRAAAAIADRRRVAADPAAAGAALSRQHRAGRATMCMRCSWISPLSGRLDQHRLRDAVHTVVTRHPQPGGPILPTSSTSRCRSSRPIPWCLAVCRARRRRLDPSMSRSSGCVPPSAPRSATSPTSRPFGRR